MRSSLVTGAAAVTLLMQASLPAQAGLIGATVQSASYFDVTYPPPAASPIECTIINCNILNYPLPPPPSNNSTNFPLPIVPVAYVEDNLSLTTVSVGDTQITITSNSAGQFGTPGTFSGYTFTFTGAPNITNVAVDNGTSPLFQPAAPPAGPPVGLTWTTDSITVNVAGDNPAVGDQLILDVTTAGTTTPVPEPGGLAMFGMGLAVLCPLVRRRRERERRPVPR